jgi:hypothetical protein
LVELKLEGPCWCLRARKWPWPRLWN